MKTPLILAFALPLFVSLASAQDKLPPSPDKKDAPAENETIRKAAPAAWLGVSMIENDGKVTISDILADSPAAKAGLQKGDVVLRVGERAVEGEAARVMAGVGERQPGDTVELRVQRGDKEESLKVQLGERPRAKEEFRGEFRRLEKKQEKPSAEQLLKDKVKEAEKHAKRLQQYRDEVEKLDDQFRKHPELHEKLQELKDNPDKLQKEFGKLKVNPDKLQKQFGELLKDREFYQYKLHQDGPELRLEKFPREFGSPDNEFRLFMGKGKPDKAAEEAVWKRVEDSVGRALKESGLGPDVIEKAMNAVRDARKNGPEQEARRAKLKAEASRIEKEMQALKERADKLRDELNKVE